MSWIEHYNTAGISDEDRHQLLTERLSSIGSGVTIRPPFFCDPGCNIQIGDEVFLNFNCVILDRFPVHIGSHTTIGPGVQILATDHPRDPALRRAHLQTGKPVTIGENVWIGGGAVIVPGVTVGDDAIIGAGSIVIEDVPSGALVVGNPARLVRP